MAGPKPFVLLDEALKQNSRLAVLLAQARLHERLLGQIRQILPQPLDSHCLYCVLRGGGRLILYTDGAAWAFRLRFYQAELRSALKEIGPLESIQIRVLLPIERVAKPPLAAKIPTPQAIDQLDKTTAAIADPDLKRSFKRLLYTLRRAAQRKM
ncbi:MAG: DciA family protein [Methylohalobius sp.]